MGFGFIVLLAVTGIVSAIKEPECPRYHYEAQTLERVIKAEINVDTLINDVQQIKQAMRNEISKHDKQYVSLEEKLEVIQQNFDKFKNKTTKKRSSMKQFCTSDDMCSDVLETECKWLTCKCKPGLSYHHSSRKCVSDCGDYGYGRTFQLEMDTLLYGLNTKTFNSISLEKCTNSCLAETGFICRTIEYKKATQTCYISLETLHTNAGKHRVNRQDYILFTRDCDADLQL